MNHIASPKLPAEHVLAISWPAGILLRGRSGLRAAMGTAFRTGGALALLIGVMSLAACGGSDGTVASRSLPSAVQGQATPDANQAPVAVIVAPAAGATFKAGDTLTIAVQGTDTEDGALAAAQITWWVDLHHDTHTHPLELQTVGTGGALTVPPRIETSPNIWLRVHVRVTDSAGASSETTRDVVPLKSTFTLATQPAGLSLTLDGSPVAAPMAVLGVVGVERDLGAADQDLGSRRYRFVNWSDAGTAVHVISTPAVATTFTAVFADNGPTSNQLPIVSAAASSVTPLLGTPVTLSALAVDGDGTVTKVEFFDGNTLVGSGTTSPYTVVWTPTTAGVHTLQARATDGVGAIGASAPLTVTVGAPAAGGLLGTYFPNTSLSGAPVLTRSEVLDFVWTGSPGAGLPADGWSARWTGFVRLPTTGTYTFEVIADDGLRATINGQSIASQWVSSGNKSYRTAAISGTAGALIPVLIEHYDGTGDSSVRLRWNTPEAPQYWVPVPLAQLLQAGASVNSPPSVALTAPASAAVDVAVALSAAAADSDGTVAKVEFFDGATLIGSDAASPYVLTWTPATAGTHILTARATDNQGGAAYSAPLTVTVTVGAPAVGGLLGTYFPNTSLSGAPVLTRSEVLDFVWTGSPGAGLPADGWSVRWTGFVRLPTTGVYTFEVIADDGLRATINGQTFASAWVSSGNKTYRSAAINGTAGALVPVLIEHYDGTGDSSVRLRWNAPSAPQYWVPVPLAQLLQTGTAVNSPPSVALTAPASAAVGVAVALSASASDSDGSVSKVEFFDGATLIGSDLSSPYGVTWTPASSGNHTLTARATDNLGGTATSTGTTLNVAPAGADLQAPSVAITSPANLADSLGGVLTVTASASDNVGVTGVDFMIDGAALVSSGAGSSYQTTVDTTLYVPGQHVIRARARDAAGNLSPWATATVRFAGTRTVPAGFTLTQPWVTGMNAGTAFTQTPDGRFLVANQDGRLLVVKAGALLSTPMLTLGVDNTGERGLIGVALHPSFATNGWFYVYYTRINGVLRNNRISRFVAQGDSTTGVETVIVDLPDLSSSFFHNGGAMRFGLDGKLYVAVGENTISSKSQDLNDPFGKMLRFNDDGTIPSNNPFCTTNGNVACAIWAYGLRNPFTFAIQPGTGRMHINDVGAGTWEEINVGAAGANYGWPASEGPSNLTAAMTAPMFTYRHTAAVPPGSGPGGFFIGNAIVGGEFYPASGAFPAQYFGKYFFADYVASYIAVLDPSNPALAFNFATLAQFPVGLLAGKDGALYVLGRTSISRITAP